MFRTSRPVRGKDGRYYATCSCGNYKSRGAPYPGHAETAAYQHIRDTHEQPISTTISVEREHGRHR